MRFVIAIMSAAVLMAQPALAATSLCVEDASTGFNWVNSGWVQANYKPWSHIVRTVPVDEAIVGPCFRRMAVKGLTSDIVKTEFTTTRSACYAMYNVGSDPTFSDVSLCLEYFSEAGDVYDVDCTDGGYNEYEFFPSGEIVITRNYAAPTVKPADMDRDSLVMSVGKCSVIQ